MKKWFKSILSGLLCGLMVFGAACGSKEPTVVDDGMRTVTFDLCTDLETNPILPKEVMKGDTVAKPIVAVKGENPNNAEVEGWYRDPEYTTPWIFLTDTVEEDITLYAKWINLYDVYYYLGEETETYMYKEQYKAGDFIIPNYTLADGFRSEGLFADPNFETPFDFTQPIDGHKNIYIHRSEEFYFSARMIAERFTCEPSMSGPAGSTAGSMELVGEGEDQYVKVNYGYSTAADPFIWLKNVTVDISHSQKIKLVMKNTGKAKSMKFFLITWYDNETQEKPYEGFTEEFAYRYDYKPEEIEMTEDDEWATIIIDLGKETLKNGISTWANSSTLLQLRIDSCYVSENEQDLSNELWIKSIEGIADDTYVTTGDGSVVSALLQNDDTDAVKAVADAQQDVLGWVFPKDYDSVSAATSDGDKHITTYNKTAGLLMYAPFRTQAARMQFKAGDETINLDDYTTLALRFRNYGYATTLKLTWRNKRGRSASKEFAIPASMDEVVECEFNMVGAMNWANNLDTLTLEYTSVGVDNAILFESVEFLPYKMIEIAGFNFDDRNAFGVESNDAMAVSYNVDEKATQFNVIDAASAVVDKAYDYRYTNMGYKYLVLTYKMAEEGVTNVKVTLTIDGETSIYSYDVAVAEKMTELKLPLSANGYITNFKMEFEGTGKILIQNIRFTTDELSALDFGAGTAYERLANNGSPDWQKTLSYDAGISAANLGPSDGYTPMKYYFGALYLWGKIGEGSAPLAGKTKVVIVYYNPGNETGLAVSLGLTDVSAPDWQSAITEAGNAQSGGPQGVTLETNMKPGEWAHAVIDLSSYRNMEDPALKALTMVSMNHLDGSPRQSSIYIRLFVII